MELRGLTRSMPTTDAELEEQRRCIIAQTEAKLEAARKAERTANDLRAEQAARAEAERRTQQRLALEARKKAEALEDQRKRENEEKRTAEEELRRREALAQKSAAKRAAKVEKKARRKAPSAFKLQAERERCEEAERLETERKAAELVAARSIADEAEDTEPGATLQQSMDNLMMSQEESAPLEPPNAPVAMGTAECSDASLCVVCDDRERTHAIYPCGHRCLCETCATLIGDTCPMCRGPNARVFRIFL